MKNLHLIPTDKPSKLYLNGFQRLLLDAETENGDDPSFTNQHIYITSDEEIKEGDWFAVELFKITGESRGMHIEKCIKLNDIWCNDFDVVSTRHKGNCNKIILTTDQDLIKDGVQAIDDEFLEWFVKNPSCEYVEVEKVFGKKWKDYEYYKEWHKDTVPDWAWDYRIIIPKEEILCKYCLSTTTCCDDVEAETCENYPKEEPTIITDWLNEHGDPEIYKKVERDLELREAAEKYSLELLEAKTIQHHEKTWIESMFIHIAKWQAERMYSEEEVESLLHKFMQHRHPDWHGWSTTKWFEQFKKK